MGTPLGIQRSAIAAVVIHFAREPVRDECTQDQDAAEDSQGDERVLQALYFSRTPRWYFSPRSYPNLKDSF